MSDETDAARRKRTGLTAACLAGAIVAAVAGVSAWYWHSRLNTAENRLVGVWLFARKDGVRVYLHFQPDRTFRYWTSAGAEESGTWKISGDEWILSFRNTNHGPPNSAWSLVEHELDRFQHPAAWADYVVTSTLEDVSSSTFRVRDHRDNAEVLYRRVDSTAQPPYPR